MGKVVNLRNKTPDENHISLSKEEEEKIIEKQYEDYYAEEEDPNPANIGNCCRCSLPISEFEALWVCNRTNKGDSHIEGDSMIFCEYCLLEFIKHKDE